MKKLTALFFAAAMALSIVLIDSTPAGAAASPSNASVQIVPKTKQISRKVYRKGRYITIRTWYHGKRISKKVWVKGNQIGNKIGRKTKEIFMGKKKRAY